MAQRIVRRGRPRGSLGEVSREMLRLAAESGPITAPMAAQRLQLSRREAASVAYELRVAGYLVPAPAPRVERAFAAGRRAVWMTVATEWLPPRHALERWLHDS